MTDNPSTPVVPEPSEPKCFNCGELIYQDEDGRWLHRTGFMDGPFCFKGKLGGGSISSGNPPIATPATLTPVPVVAAPLPTSAEKGCVQRSIDFIWKSIANSQGEFFEAIKVVLHFAEDQLATTPSPVSREPLPNAEMVMGLDCDICRERYGIEQPVYSGHYSIVCHKHEISAPSGVSREPISAEQITIPVELKNKLWAFLNRRMELDKWADEQHMLRQGLDDCQNPNREVASFYCGLCHGSGKDFDSKGNYRGKCLCVRPAKDHPDSFAYARAAAGTCETKEK